MASKPPFMARVGVKAKAKTGDEDEAEDPRPESSSSPSLSGPALHFVGSSDRLTGCLCPAPRILEFVLPC